MLIFGWGSKQKSWALQDGLQLVATWSYFHILWCPIAHKVTWHIIGNNRSEDRIISKEQLRSIVPTGTPNIGIWNRFGLLISIVVVIILGQFI